MTKSSDLSGLLLAMGVGTALSSWAGFEVRLTHLYAVLTDMPDQAKACAVFDTIISFEVRLALCNRLMEAEACSELEKAVWRAFKLRAEKLYKKRHGIAHFSIVEATGKRGKKTVHLSPFLSQSRLAEGRASLLSAKDLKRRSDEFDELREAIVWFWAQARNRRGLLSEPDQPSSPPPLLLRLEATVSQTLKSPR
ncbi:MAG TPA: hypothetical protein VGB79_08095 [Allosphingosinicella sp.]|jgi:hypothetical protein